MNFSMLGQEHKKKTPHRDRTEKIQKGCWAAVKQEDKGGTLFGVPTENDSQRSCPTLRNMGFISVFLTP